MRITFSVLTLLASFSPLFAELPATTQMSHVVGSVYGKTITTHDIGMAEPIDPTVQFDARDTARWEQMKRISQVFGSPVVERFVEEKQIGATAEEIEAFQNKMRPMREQHLRDAEDRLARVKARRASSNLSDEEKATLEKEQAQLDELLPLLRDAAKQGAPERMARQFIVHWKTERELHRTFGGRVIFQQAGPEALDARRMLYEQAEKSGDLTITDPGVRHLLYYYANMNHRTIDESAIEQPWFLEGEK